MKWGIVGRIIGRIIGLAALAAALGGCATVTRGSTELFSVRSVPPGATASSKGWECTTPCKVTVKRRGDFVVLFRKEGFADQTVKVFSVPVSGQRGLRQRVGADVGWVGQATDFATGANYEHRPNPLEVTLEPIPGAASED